jgi:hypothetical protein
VTIHAELSWYGMSFSINESSKLTLHCQQSLTLLDIDDEASSGKMFDLFTIEEYKSVGAWPVGPKTRPTIALLCILTKRIHEWILSNEDTGSELDRRAILRKWVQNHDARIPKGSPVLLYQPRFTWEDINYIARYVKKERMRRRNEFEKLWKVCDKEDGNIIEAFEALGGIPLDILKAEVWKDVKYNDRSIVDFDEMTDQEIMDFDWTPGDFGMGISFADAEKAERKKTTAYLEKHKQAPSPKQMLQWRWRYSVAIFASRAKSTKMQARKLELTYEAFCKDGKHWTEKMEKLEIGVVVPDLVSDHSSDTGSEKSSKKASR